MIDQAIVQSSLSTFGRNTIYDARTNLLGKNATRKLSQSLRFELEVFKNSFYMDFFGEDYAKFQDQGVSGTKRKFDTPFAYTTKRPPLSAFNVWSVRRGLAGRDGLGRFTARKSLLFALAEYIFQYGIKPSKFFTNALNENFDNLPDEVVEAYALEIDKFMKTLSIFKY